MSRRRLILVRHATPSVDEGGQVPAAALDDRAREDCVLLAHALSGVHQPEIRTSPEPLARQTADVLGLRLGSWPVDDPCLGGVRASTRFDEAVERASTGNARDLVVVAGDVALAGYLASLGFPCTGELASNDGHPMALELDRGRGVLKTLFPTLMPTTMPAG